MNIHIGLLHELPITARTVILIGSATSDHLRELARFAEFKGRAAYRIQQADDLQPRWFAGQQEVGIVLGDQGLRCELQRVLDRLKDFARAEARGMLEGVAL